MCLFCTPGVDDRHNLILNGIHKLYLFTDGSFCINSMLEIVSKNKFLTPFGTSQWALSHRKSAMSAERTCQPKEWFKRMKTQGNFLNFFQHPVLAEGYDQDEWTTSILSQEKKQRVVPKLMNIIQKGIIRTNQE